MKNKRISQAVIKKLFSGKMLVRSLEINALTVQNMKFSIRISPVNVTIFCAVTRAIYVEVFLVSSL